MNIIYLDFEGFKKGPPSLVGESKEGVFKQFALTQKLEGAAKTNNILVLTPEEYCQAKIEEIEQGYVLAGYTQFEKNTFKELINKDIPYFDTHKLAKAWIKKHHLDQYQQLTEWNAGINTGPWAKKRWKLETMLKFIEYRIPQPYGTNLTTRWLKDIINSLEANHQVYADITARRKMKWTNFLKHNHTDVNGMIVLTKRIKEEDPELFNQFLNSI